VASGRGGARAIRDTSRRRPNGYRVFVADGLPQGRRPELTGGGLVRSTGGWTALTARRCQGDRLHGDERILGDSEFVETALRTAGERLERRHRFQVRGRDFAWLLQRIAAVADLRSVDVFAPNKSPSRVEYRSLLCYLAVRELGLPGTIVAGKLGLSQSAASRAVVRGERLVRKKGEKYRKRIIS
jgi:putative transposase